MPLKIKNTLLGNGAPKICVPITARTIPEVKQELISYLLEHVDAIEWRIDYLDNLQEVPKCLPEIYTICGKTLLLVTYRTPGEGGNREISEEEYLSLYRNILMTKSIDLLDVESHFANEEKLNKLIEYAHSLNQHIVVSNHNFSSTPSYEEILKELERMKKTLHADICKIAYMPTNTKDVLTVLQATEYAHSREEEYGPIISMSMGQLGVITRISGETFGSCLTFAKMGEGSAPGQLDLQEASQILNILHRAIQ